MLSECPRSWRREVNTLMKRLPALLVVLAIVWLTMPSGVRRR